jgi:hypothetical protein
MEPSPSESTLIPASQLVVELQERVGSWRQRQAERRVDELELEVTAEQAESHELAPIVTAFMERNLARKGVWVTEPDRRQLEWRYTTEDVVGSLTVEMSLGQLSTFEMELVAWVLGRWQADRPADGRVTFSLRECAREFGTRWGGSRSEFLKEALRRIDRTRFTGRVWNASSRKHVMRHFGIFDEVETVDYRDSFDGPSFEPGTVTVKLSGFLVDQLTANQLDKLNWAALRRGIKSPLGKRLYVFLRSQEGFPTADGLRFYENGIDRELTTTLGVRDVQVRRVRSKLTRAGQEIVAADDRYREVVVRKGKGQRVYVLRAVWKAS